jgi:hypothetical protein
MSPQESVCAARQSSEPFSMQPSTATASPGVPSPSLGKGKFD